MDQYLEWYRSLQFIVFVVSKKQEMVPCSLSLGTPARDALQYAHPVVLEQLAHMNIDDKATMPRHDAPASPLPETEPTFPESHDEHLSHKSLSSSACQEDGTKIITFLNDLSKELFEKACKHSYYMSAFVEYCLNLNEANFKHEKYLTILEDVRILSKPVIDDNYVYTL